DRRAQPSRRGGAPRRRPRVPARRRRSVPGTPARLFGFGAGVAGKSAGDRLRRSSLRRADLRPACGWPRRGRAPQSGRVYGQAVLEGDPVGRKERYLVGLDVGTSKITAIVGEATDEVALDIIGI